MWSERFRARGVSALYSVLVMCLLILVQMPLALTAEEDPGEDYFSKEQIENFVAPVALYPDPLLAQILMASTYPLEVVRAARWVEENPDVKGDDLEDAMEEQPWDSSVRSLTAFPQVLKMMNDQLDWTQNLGDAFLAQQQEVLDAVQKLRERADAEGNLDDVEELTIKKEEVEPEETSDTASEDTPKSTTVIVIEPASPEVIYVPVYNPTVVFGVWPHPLFRPFFWYPPGFVAGRRLFWFGAGVVAGSALWGRVGWRNRSVNININRYNSFNRTNITNNRWSHNPRHRRAVPYRGREVNERFSNRNRERPSREEFRGRAERGREELRRTDANRRTDRQNREALQNRQNRETRQNRQNREALQNRQNRQAIQNRQTQQNRQTRQNRNQRSVTNGVRNPNRARQNSTRGRNSRQARTNRQRPNPAGGRRRR